MKGSLGNPSVFAEVQLLFKKPLVRMMLSNLSNLNFINLFHLKVLKIASIVCVLKNNLLLSILM